MASSQQLLLGTGTAVNQYQIQRSLRFNSADSAYLNRTPASAGNRQTFTYSVWTKRSALGAGSALLGVGTNTSDDVNFTFTSSDTLEVLCRVSSSIVVQLATTQVFRDVGAWHHIVVAIDTTQATSSNRVKIYVNGQQVTAFGTATYPSQNQSLAWNNNVAHEIGRVNNQFGPGQYINGYMTNINFIDGQALTPSSFGETNADTGVWQPKAYSGTFGTNGFQLLFADNSGTTSTTLGKDTSGNGNNWTPNNFYVGPGTTNAEKAGIDSLVDTPTPYGTDTGAGGEVRGNYCTANPLDIFPKSGTWTVSNGNLDLSLSGAVWDAIRGTTGVTSGKWYWEITATGINNTNSYAMVGIQKGAGGNWQDPFAYVYYSLNGQKYNNGSGAAYGNSWTTNDVIGVAFDADAGEIKFYKNNTVQNSGTAAYTGLTSGPYTPVIMLNGTGSAATVTCNFGQRPFAYTAPSGFKALCTQNLPTPTIGATSTTQAGKYFNTIIWTGTDTAASRSFTGVGFQPDFVWAKIRSNTGFEHLLYDAVRGAGNDKELSSDSPGAEGYLNTDAQGYLSSFNSDGFSSTVGTIQNEWFNRTGFTYVAWNWNAGGSSVTNTAGTITSTVRANTTAGFSIVTYTGNGTNGATVGHGCQVNGVATAPRMMIFKQRSGTTSWPVYHTSLTSANYALFLNLTIAEDGPNTAYFNNTAPSSTVFTLGNLAGINGNGNTFVAYCFAPVAGYSAFGSYTGNGSADGTFVYTGFRPKYVMLKASSRIEAWYLFDTARNPYNVADNRLYANTSGAEGTGGSYGPDILSNGFKLRTSDSGFNFSGATYIYAAFAENPFKYSLAR